MVPWCGAVVWRRGMVPWYGGISMESVKRGPRWVMGRCGDQVPEAACEAAAGLPERLMLVVESLGEY